MAQRVCETIHDLTRHGGCIVAQCPCGRVALFSISQLSGLFDRRRWAADIHSVSARLRCTGCNRRGIKAWYCQPPVPAWGAALFMVIRVPKGVPIMDFAMADDRERRRLIRQARG